MNPSWRHYRAPLLRSSDRDYVRLTIALAVFGGAITALLILNLMGGR